MNNRSLVLWLLCAVALSVTAFAQNTNTNEQRREVSASSAKPAEPKITDEDRAKATQLLEQSEAQSRAFDAPLRSYMLYQIAQSYLLFDKEKSRALYKDAFTSTFDIRDDDDLKQRIQDAILSGLLTVSQPDVEELLPQAEPQARRKATVAITQRYLTMKKFDQAVDMVERMSSWTEFPYSIATQIMAALPEQRDADFRSLFSQAVASYQTHEHKGVNVGGSLSEMIVKFGLRLPPAMVLGAIEEILKQSKAQDNASISLSGDGGIASFGSAYEYQLFQLLPLLRKLDEGRAKALLDDSNQVRALSQKFPNGVQSLDPGSADAGKPNTADPNAKPRSSGMSISVSDGKDAQGPSAEQQMRFELERRAQQIARDSESDPTQAIAQAASLPAVAGDDSPRAQALGSIAQLNRKKNPVAAKNALDEMHKAIQDLKPERQVRYLTTAADLYLQMDETESAQKTLTDGFKLSEKMLASDKDADDPNKALKAYWPSVESYRQFLDLETKISQKDALAMLSDIQDEEMQTIERVMFTNALLGKPMKTSIVSQKKKSGNWMSISNSN